MKEKNLDPSILSLSSWKSDNESVGLGEQKPKSGLKSRNIEDSLLLDLDKSWCAVPLSIFQFSLKQTNGLTYSHYLYLDVHLLCSMTKLKEHNGEV